MDNPTRVLLVGCGGISNAWLDAAKNFADAEIVGLVDLDRSRAEAQREKHGLSTAAVGTSLAQALGDLQPDAVFDCTVPEAHVTVTLQALAAGCHVLGEKPMADTMENAVKMVAAAKDAQRIYAVIQNRRYLDEIRRYRALVREGGLGALTTLNADFYLGVHFGGFRDAMEHVLLLDMAIHSFDQARFIGGADAVRVYCHEWNPPGSWYRHGASAVAIFEMSDGSVLNYRGSWCSEGLNTSWQCRWRAVCTGGSAEWDGEQSMQAAKVDGHEGITRPTAPVAPPDLPPLQHKNHAGVIRDFLDAVRHGRRAHDRLHRQHPQPRHGARRHPQRHRATSGAGRSGDIADA
jgi:predicted dehydrogenase